MAIDLSALKARKTPMPPRILVHGSEGIGKSTFFSEAPSPIYLQLEDGINQLEVARYPEEGPATSLAQCEELLDSLAGQGHEFRTLVIDSADWLERLVWDRVCDDHGVKSIEDIGYAKGYVFAVDIWKRLLDKLDVLRRQGMVVCMTAHSQIKRFDDPSSDSYDRYMIKLHAKSGAMIKEWCDIIGYASQRVAVKGEDVGFGKKVKRGMSVGERLLHVVEEPAFEAKNRFRLTNSVLLRWGALMEAIKEAGEKKDA